MTALQDAILAAADERGMNQAGRLAIIRRVFQLLDAGETQQAIIPKIPAIAIELAHGADHDRLLDTHHDHRRVAL